MKRVYIVDDNEHVRSSLAALLSSHDYLVVEYDGGKRFLRDLPNLQNGVALIDLNMPEVDGNEVISAIDCSGKDITAIVISANSSRNNLLHGTRVQDVFAKPFDENRLIECLDEKFSD